MHTWDGSRAAMHTWDRVRAAMHTWDRVWAAMRTWDRLADEGQDGVLPRQRQAPLAPAQQPGSRASSSCTYGAVRAAHSRAPGKVRRQAHACPACARATGEGAAPGGAGGRTRRRRRSSAGAGMSRGRDASVVASPAPESPLVSTTVAHCHKHSAVSNAQASTCTPAWPMHASPCRVRPWCGPPSSAFFPQSLQRQPEASQASLVRCGTCGSRLQAGAVQHGLDMHGVAEGGTTHQLYC